MSEFEQVVKEVSSIEGAINKLYQEHKLKYFKAPTKLVVSKLIMGQWIHEVRGYKFITGRSINQAARITQYGGMDVVVLDRDDFTILFG
ncbi:hypothetical protein ACSHUI_00410 [Bacillus subtilis]|uniref:hypothetical protein n=1 Tax=Bacillus subtilis TaxID=1423 RepID=UPI003CF7DDA5